jgi:hypothetical protein
LFAIVLAAAVASAAFVGQRFAAKAAAVRMCGVDDLAVKSTDARRQGRDVVVVTALGTWGTSPSLLRQRLTVAVKPYQARFSSGATVRGIRGNPATRTVRFTLRPGNAVVYSWRWKNWCGRLRGFSLQAAWGRSSRVPSQRVRPPACASRGKPSALAPATVSVRRCSTGDYPSPPIWDSRS